MTVPGRHGETRKGARRLKPRNLIGHETRGMILRFTNQPLNQDEVDFLVSGDD